MRPKHTAIPITCPQCGKTRMWKRRAVGDRQPIHCSRTCAIKARAFLQPIPCSGCGNPFQPKTRFLKSCSSECAGLVIPGDSDLERFWNRVDTSGECWTWTGSRTISGYPMMTLYVNGKRTRPKLMTRYIYEILNGPIPDGLFIMHACDNPPCVRPDHLSAGTPKENSCDRILRGRHIRDGRVPNAKLTLTQAEEIRARYRTGGIFQKDLARAYNVSPGIVQRIVSGNGYLGNALIRS